MKNAIVNVLIFAAGAAIGSVVTWKLVKTKYEKIANEEIESVKERFADLKNNTDEAKDEPELERPDEKPAPDPKSDVVKKEYRTIIEESGYSNEEVEDVGTKPYVIAPDEFGEIEEYTVASLTYYADNVLTDDWDNIIKNVDELVGKDSLKRFGEYEDDSVFVRNEQTQTDYEILLDVRTFKEATEFNRRLQEED